MSTVYAAFSGAAERHPAADFLHIPAQASRAYADGPVDLSYEDAGARVETLRASYAAAGYGCGHRVALMLQNRAEFFLHWFALNALGVCVVPVNDEMSTEERAYIAGHSEACLLLHLPELGDKARATASSFETPLSLQASDAGTAPPPPAAAALTGTPGEATECALLYTSGSTGKPKGCILDNRYFLLSGQRYLDLGGLCTLEPGRERLLTPLPLVHMNAMACSTLAMLLSGGCLIQVDRFHPRSWWQTVRDSRATIIHYLGVMPAMLLGMEPGDDDFSRQLRFGFGAGVNPRHHAAFERRFGFPLIEAWGMTETGNHGAIIASREPRNVGTCCFGRPPPHLEIRLIDETGGEVPAGEPGELLIRHTGTDPQRGFFRGYLKDESATREAWEGGWFHTGDVVRQDADGAMYFVDRRKNVIRRSGENISALEVEAALSEDPAIAMAVVCPVPDEVRGDEVMACVIPAPGTDANATTAEAIVTRSLQRLAYYKAPGYIGFHEGLPLTPSEKPRRAEIRAIAMESLEQSQCHDLRHLKKRQRGSGA